MLEKSRQRRVQLSKLCLQLHGIVRNIPEDGNTDQKICGCSAPHWKTSTRTICQVDYQAGSLTPTQLRPLQGRPLSVFVYLCREEWAAARGRGVTCILARVEVIVARTQPGRS